MRILLILISMVSCMTVWAQEDTPLTEEEMAAAEVEPLELEPLTVTDIPWTLEQETTLRVVRHALEQTRSDRREDIDNWVCWFEKSTGTHLSYLKCARNGDLWALRPDGGGSFGSVMNSLPQGRAGYGKILVSTRPANKAKIMKALRAMPGSAEYDEEFIVLAARGETPPQDIPTDDELDRFAEAYRQVRKLDRRRASDDELIKAIEAEGLTLKRYNRLVDLVEEFQSIENQVAERLGK